MSRILFLHCTEAIKKQQQTPQNKIRTF